MKGRSIGARLTLRYAAAFACALLLLAGGMLFAVRQSLYHAIDDSLGDQVEGIRRFIAEHEARLELDEVKEEFRAHGDMFQVIDQSGRPIYRAQTLRNVTAPVASDVGATGRFDNVTGSGAEPLRFLSRDVEIGGRQYTVQVATPLRDLQQGLRGAFGILLLTSPLVLLLASGGGYWMSRRALAPVDQITRAARSITADKLSERLAVPKTGDELERLSRTLNDMIERLEESFKRISQFTTDASHELRTPLAVMRTTAEVALRRSDEAGEHRQALEQIVAELEQTSNLVENLLLVARADAGGGQLLARPVNLVDAVGEACAEASVLARVKGVRIDARLPAEPVWVAGDPQALRRLFLILLDNAVKYTAAGGRSEASIVEAGGFAVGTIADTGIGIPDDDLARIFDRFYRVDRARSRQGGTGLGLAIGRWIAEVHGGTISVDSEVDRGSRFTVRLPVAPPSA
jgi:heavy metal sensor kinase